ncbi:telomeric repeat-binding factor 2-interacting protein 1 [Rhinatrema bivittatum]|uniref:telomeric repeat-binding factor 2-interacting protein 1 n=1 Tax=Rhinatrema bivittatum TaxID=194408 RepID=UPI0011263208|nr:telomeric repeat-binding factor 2-interacting protein 1 [Rhinatrema bivittatum]
MAADFNHSRTLFVKEDGSPMRFYLRPCAAKRQLHPLILHGGGVMCRLQEPGAVLLREPGEAPPAGAAGESEASGSAYISVRYVTDCVERNEKLDVCDYQLRGAAGNVSGTCCAHELPRFLGSGRTAFSRAEDVAILVYLRDHAAPESGYAGNAIWKELQRLQLTRHSWQAMRDRYLKHLRGREDSYQLEVRTLVPLVVFPHCSRCPQPNESEEEPHAGDCTLQPHSETHRIEEGETSLQGNTCPAPIRLPEEETETCSIEDLPDKTAAKLHMRKAAKMQEESNLNSDKVLKVQKKAAEKELSAEEGIIGRFETTNQEIEVNDKTLKIVEALSPEKDKEQTESPEPQTVKETQMNVMSEDSADPDPLPQGEMTSGPPKTEEEELKGCIQRLMEEFGFSLSVITQALLKNSGELEATKYFLKNKRRADGYPLWTFQDDMLLEEKDPKFRRKLINKFGAENVAKRYKFLNS